MLHGEAKNFFFKVKVRLFIYLKKDIYHIFPKG